MKSIVFAACCLTIAAPAAGSEQSTGALTVETSVAKPAHAEAYKKALGGSADDVDAFIDSLLHVTLTSPEGTRQVYVLMEGDILATEQQARARIAELRSRGRPASGRVYGELLVMTDSAGEAVIWPKGQRALTYAVDKSSFANEHNYSEVVKHLGYAVADWVGACLECGISFHHLAELDVSKPTTDQANFIVTYAPAATGFIAAAPFPNDVRDKRRLLVGPQYFQNNTFDRTGVFRHELGHVLGYRHMHIIGVPDCATEDSNWKPVSSDYDRLSVMHYLCGGGGTRKMELSDTDKRDHASLYRSDQ